MKQIQKTLISLICLILAVAVILPTTIFAWFRINSVIKLNSTGKSIVKFFASGTGTETDRYVISNATHLNNLAWLQDLGMLQDKKYYFELEKDIDMEGLAIPPIGNDTYPFIGDFNGNSKVISNLVVSNNINELHSHFNINKLVLDNHVGFFGKIDIVNIVEEGETVKAIGRANDFYLKDVGISTVSIGGGDITMGIVAAHSNGLLENIGVSNNTFKVSAGSQVQSQYTLIGEIGDDSLWSDFPVIGAGNQILVNPNDLTFSSLQPDTNGQKYVEVSGSVPGHAYYTSTLTVNQDKFGKAIYKVNMPEEDTGGNRIITADVNSSVQFNPNGSQFEDFYPDLADFYNNVYNNRNFKNFIIPSGTPSPQNLMSITSDLQIPYNGIWFKPMVNARSNMVFTKTNSSGIAMISVYEYQRDSNNQIVNWREIQFRLATGDNKHVFCFGFNVKKDCEYVIGRSSEGGNTSAGFLYLILGGAGEGGSTMGEIRNVDFVLEETLTAPMTGNEITNTHLSISGTVADTGDSYYLIYFNKKEHVIEGVPITAVFYYCPDGSGVAVTENLTQNTESYGLDNYIPAIFTSGSPP